MPETGEGGLQAVAGALALSEDQPLFGFTVPDELLQEAVSKSHHKEAVADVALMPGVGEGKPPPLLPILREHGFAPLVLLTAAAVLPSTFGNGISLVGNNLEKSFHLHDSGLGAIGFVAGIAPLLWAVPLALWADRGARKVVSGVAVCVIDKEE